MSALDAKSGVVRVKHNDGTCGSRLQEQIEHQNSPHKQTMAPSAEGLGEIKAVVAQNYVMISTFGTSPKLH